MSFDVFIRCNHCGQLCEIRDSAISSGSVAHPEPSGEPAGEPEAFAPPAAEAPAEKRKDGVLLRPPTDDVPTDDAELMRQAQDGRWGTRLANAIRIGGLGIDKVRMAVEQMTRPGRSQPEAPTEDPA